MTVHEEGLLHARATAIDALGVRSLDHSHLVHAMRLP
jgi:hypothetical protein